MGTGDGVWWWGLVMGTGDGVWWWGLVMGTGDGVWWWGLVMWTGDGVWLMCSCCPLETFCDFIAFVNIPGLY